MSRMAAWAFVIACLGASGAEAAPREPIFSPTRAEDFGGAWFLAKVEAAGPRVGFLVRNKSNKELIEFQAKIVGVDGWGEPIFAAHGQWLGSLPKRNDSAILGFEMSVIGEGSEILAPLAAKVRIEPVFVRYADGSVVGRPAKWSLGPGEQQRLRSGMESSMGAAAKQAGGGVSAAAMAWAMQGEVARQPARLRIAYGWRNAGSTPVNIQGAKAVFSSKTGPLLRAEIWLPEKIAPGQDRFAWVEMAFFESEGRRWKALEAASQSRRVDAVGIYGPATP